MAGWLAGWVAGWLAGWETGWAAGWLAGWLADGEDDDFVVDGVEDVRCEVEGESLYLPSNTPDALKGQRICVT